MKRVLLVLSLIICVVSGICAKTDTEVSVYDVSPSETRGNYDKLEYTIYNDNAYIKYSDIWSGDENARDMEVTVPATVEVDGKSYKVSGFYATEHYTYYDEGYGDKFYFPKSVTLPASCTIYVVATTDWHAFSDVKYRSYNLIKDVILANAYLNLEYCCDINYSANLFGYFTYDGCLYQTSTSQTPIELNSYSPLNESQIGTAIYCPPGKKEITGFAPGTIGIESTFCHYYNNSGGTPKKAYDSQLESVTINNDKILSANIFKDCSKLRTLIISDPVTEIKEKAFYQYDNISEVILSEGVKKIGEKAFEGCSRLKEITVSSTVTTIGTRAFYDCPSLTKISLLNEDISGENVFALSATSSVKEPREITFGENFSCVGKYAFNNNIIRTLNGSESITHIYNNAFENVSWSPDIDLNFRNLMLVADYAFYNNQVYDINSITFGSLEKIGENAFFGLFPKEINCDMWQPVESKSPNIFNNQTYNYTVLNVPEGTEDIYSHINPWSNFEHISGLKFEGVKSVIDSENLVITVSGESLTIEGADNQPVEIYSLSGEKVYSGYGDATLSLAKGTYIIKAAHSTRKVLL